MDISRFSQRSNFEAKNVQSSFTDVSLYYNTYTHFFSMFSAGVCGFKSEWKIQNDEREIFGTKSGTKVNKLLSDKQS